MKLKRFLLRYNPPGVGFEVEDNGVIGVHHKDLRLASEVRSSEEIDLLVDELIAGEPSIHFKSKHRPALEHLLRRLYHLEVSVARDEEDDGHSSGQSPASSEEADGPGWHAEAAGRRRGRSSPQVPISGLEEGQKVVLFGLQGDEQAYNGEQGILIKSQEAKGKFQVRMGTASAKHVEVLKLRNAENILPVAVAEDSLSIGTHALIRGLHNHKELNGCLCRVVQCFDDAQRYQVCEFETGLLLRMKPENLIPLLSCQHVLSVALRVSPVSSPVTSPMVNSHHGNAGDREGHHSSSCAQGLHAKGDPEGHRSSSGAQSVHAKGDPEGHRSSSGAQSVHAKGLSQTGPAGASSPGQRLAQLGDVIRIVGLKTSTEYNGHQAVILGVDKEGGRYLIKLRDGSQKTIKFGNASLTTVARA